MVIWPVKLSSSIVTNSRDEGKEFTSDKTTALIVKYTSAVMFLRSIMEEVN